MGAEIAIPPPNARDRRVGRVPIDYIWPEELAVLRRVVATDGPMAEGGRLFTTTTAVRFGDVARHRQEGTFGDRRGHGYRAATRVHRWFFHPWAVMTQQICRAREVELRTGKLGVNSR